MESVSLWGFQIYYFFSLINFILASNVVKVRKSIFFTKKKEYYLVEDGEIEIVVIN